MSSHVISSQMLSLSEQMAVQIRESDWLLAGMTSELKVKAEIRLRMN